jgi:hypothetical protein|tara:strand:+ start:116 stop:406 length:291 start_codon:yes stop_codon:yes gene_type:complete
MALIAKGKKTIVEVEVSQLSKEDIEFILNIIENSMVPGKYIGLGNVVIQKLQNQIGILDRSKDEVMNSLKKYKQNSDSSKLKKVQNKNGELWIEEN